MKKYLLGFLIISFLALGAFALSPVKAKAISLNDINSLFDQVKSLKDEIANLKSKLGAQVAESIVDTGTSAAPGSTFTASEQDISVIWPEIDVSILEQYGGWSFNQFYNLSSSIICEIQSTLIALGYNPGVKDCKWGWNTWSAFQEWVKDQQSQLGAQVVESIVDTGTPTAPGSTFPAQVESIVDTGILTAPGSTLGAQVEGGDTHLVDYIVRMDNFEITPQQTRRAWANMINGTGVGSNPSIPWLHDGVSISSSSPPPFQGGVMWIFQNPNGGYTKVLKLHITCGPYGKVIAASHTFWRDYPYSPFKLVNAEIQVIPISPLGSGIYGIMVSEPFTDTDPKDFIDDEGFLEGRMFASCAKLELADHSGVTDHFPY